MFDRIENETGYQIKERTLGGCLSAIREAKKSKKMSPALALCVRSMTPEFFDKHASRSSNCRETGLFMLKGGGEYQHKSCSNGV